MILLIYSFILLLTFFLVLKKQTRLNLIVIFLVAMVIRIIFVFLSDGITNYDLDSYHLIGEVTLKGINIYPNVALLHHPYFPLIMYVEAFAMWIDSLGISYVIVLKSIFILFDLGIIYMVYMLSKKNETMALLYALNPISSLIVAFQGQFDSIALFLLLLSIYQYKKSKLTISMLIASVAVATKTWPIIFMIPYLKRVPLKYLLLIPILPIILIVVYNIIFDSSIQAILHTIYSYRGIVGNYGLGFVYLRLPDLMHPLIKIFSYLSILIGIFYILRNKNLPFIYEINFICLLFFSVTLGFGMQWIAWVVPFLIIYRVKYISLFFMVATVYISINYFAWITKYDLTISILLLGQLLWITVLIMFYSFIKNSKLYINNKNETKID